MTGVFSWGCPGLDEWKTNPDPERPEPDLDEPQDFDERAMEAGG